MNIREWEDYTYLDNKGDLELKPTAITFGIALWIFAAIALTISVLTNHYSIESFDDVFALFFLAIIGFVIFCLAGVILGGISQILMKAFKIKRPLVSFCLSFIVAGVLFGLYSLYRAYWPIGEEQILTEGFMTSKGRIEVVHREKCKYYRSFFQEKENFQDFVKGKNTMYCTCVDDKDIDLLDSYSNKNQRKVKDKMIDDGMKGYYDISEEYDEFEEWFDETKRGHKIFFVYEPIKKEYISISSKEVYEEYYKGIE
jgi:hypothetical protein